MGKLEYLSCQRVLSGDVLFSAKAIFPQFALTKLLLAAKQLQPYGMLFATEYI
jgi:hypothetical protein